MVFFELGAVMDGHVPPGEVHHFAAGGDVSVE
jgi:hypothetical protein